jgi:Uma2 family endonuclease
METVISSPLQDTQPDIYYPDSDGQPMANNTEHFEHIATTKYGLESVFAERDDVFVAGDLFWYPVKGRVKTVLAPDVMVAVGRPKGQRKSYKQWEEGGIAPQVVFEFLSESNTQSEMMRKAMFFERYGVQEYYIYDLRDKELSGFIRFQEEDVEMEPIPDMHDWRSPRLGISFDMSSGSLILRKPDGEPFMSYDEVEHLLYEERQRANAQEQRANAQEQRANAQEQRANAQEQRANALATKLRELGINPETL